jgi:DNA-directed RNA polymerase specialized sigma subunit
MQYTNDNHFKTFAKNLAHAIEYYGDLSEETLIDRQQRQMDQLVGLETRFRRTLIAHHYGNWVYKRFVRFICEERKNILAARPYFRERQNIFTKEISKALKKRAEKSLYRFHFNFQFVLFVMKTRKWGESSDLPNLYRQIVQIRTEMVEMNMPLAINRSKIFYSRTPASHLTYMDFIQISCEGLMSAVDKFVPPFSPVFRSVAIGRMVGNFIENYSETLLHFFPVDKRKIYRANKLVGKHVGIVNFEKLAEDVNEDVDAGYHTTPEEIASLMAASSCVSADTGTVSESASSGSEVDVPKLIDRFEASEDTRPDLMVEEAQAMTAMKLGIGGLTPFEKKFLRLKGIHVEV